MSLSLGKLNSRDVEVIVIMNSEVRSVSITDEWSYKGLKTIVLENEYLRVVVFPELGAKIYDIVYKPIGRNVLWHNPRISPRKIPFGVPFDDVWSGGWDEIFPNDAPSVVDGEKYPDMGEIWSIEWDYSIIKEPKGSVTLITSTYSPISTCRITRYLTMMHGESQIHMRYVLTNVGVNKLRFLWKLHPALDINETCVIEIKGKAGTLDPRYRHLFSESSYEYAWPIAVKRNGEAFDVSRVQPKTDNTCTLHYVRDLSEGEVRLTNPRDGVNFTLIFPKEVLNCVWLFLPYGGYRGIYNAVIEPSTSYPYDLGQAIRDGHYSSLEPGETLDCSVLVTIGRNDSK